MQPDVFLIIGLILTVFSIPAMLSAFVDGRAPRASAIVLLIGGALVWMAIEQKPGGYTIQDIPEAFVRVVALVVR